MPKVAPLGNRMMQAAATAKATARRAILTPHEMRTKIGMLRMACGLKRREQLATAIGMSEDRLDYICSNPEACKLSEGLLIQTFARAHGIDVFEVLKGEAG